MRLRVVKNWELSLMILVLENLLRKLEGVKRVFCFMSRIVMNGIFYIKYGDYLISLVILKDRGYIFSIKWWVIC